MTDFNDARSGLYAGVILGGFATLAFGILMLVSVIDVLRSLGSGGRVSTTSLLVGGVGIIVTLVFGLLMLSSIKRLSHWQRINDRGTVAWATMGEPRRTNSRINRRNLYDIPLTVAPPQGAPYTVKANWFFPMDLRNVAQPGIRVVVRIDPEDMSSVLVDWEQTRASWGLPPPPPQA